MVVEVVVVMQHGVRGEGEVGAGEEDEDRNLKDQDEVKEDEVRVLGPVLGPGDGPSRAG